MATAGKDVTDRTGWVVGGRYRLIRKLASGGMATVYEATHELTLKRVAVKVLHPGLLVGTQARERFFREAQAPASIGHPGIVDITDAGVDEDGSLFLVMELLEGASFGGLLARPTTTRYEAMKVVEALLAPLEAAHARGFVHRDLKPDNVFVAQDGTGGRRVLLLDFGIARASASHLTRTGTFMGTFGYASPEQARSPQDATAAADVWAVGVMLYRSLAGRLPFRGDGVDAVLVAANEPHEPLDRIDPWIPEPLARLVDRCLYKQPEDRPTDAGALRQALADVLADESAAEALAARIPAGDGARETKRLADRSTVRPAGTPSEQEATAMVLDTADVPMLGGSATEIVAPTSSEDSTPEETTLTAMQETATATIATPPEPTTFVGARPRRSRRMPVIAIAAAAIASIAIGAWIAATGGGSDEAPPRPEPARAGERAIAAVPEAPPEHDEEEDRPADAVVEETAPADVAPETTTPAPETTTPAAETDRRAARRRAARRREAERRALREKQSSRRSDVGSDDVRYGPNMAPILR